MRSATEGRLVKSVALSGGLAAGIATRTFTGLLAHIAIRTHSAAPHKAEQSLSHLRHRELSSGFKRGEIRLIAGCRVDRARHLSEDNPGFVSIAAMVETAWVLERSYGLAGHELAAIIERLLQAPVLVVENEVEVFTAMTALREDRGDFADTLLGELGRKAGCSVTFTFDQKAARLPGFALA